MNGTGSTRVWGSQLPLGVHVPDDVVHRSFEAETVLLNLRTGTYHGLNRSGGRMFELLAASGDPMAAAGAIAEEFAAPIEQVVADLAQLIGELADRGLVVVDAAPA